MVKAQEYIDQNYSEEERKNIEKLGFDNELLEGKLDLNDFVNLESLDCSHNQLTSLNLNKCVKLKYLNCSDNLITELDISQNIELKRLEIDNNNFSHQNLNFLSHLVNLEWLELQNGNK